MIITKDIIELVDTEEYKSGFETSPLSKEIMEPLAGRDQTSELGEVTLDNLLKIIFQRG